MSNSLAQLHSFKKTNPDYLFLCSNVKLKVLTSASQHGEFKRAVSELENTRIKVVPSFCICYREELGQMVLVRLIIILISYLNDKPDC